MKIRTGFVSNSSSSSFCILGYVFSEDELCKMFNIEDDGEQIYNFLEEKLDRQSLIKYSRGLDDFYEHLVIGSNISSLEENFTIAENRVLIKENMLTLGFKVDKNPSFLVDGGRDD